MSRPLKSSGYTLIEMTIMVAIIAILAAVAIPQFSNLLLKANEAETKSNLGAIRSALSIYYGDTDGLFPTNINALVPKYINKIPPAILPSHDPS